MSHKENKVLFFDVIKNDQIFPSKVCHVQYDHRFLFDRKTGEHYKEISLQKVIKFGFLI